MSRNILIIGATSGIGRAIAARLAAGGDRVLLAGRDAEELRRLSADLSIRHSAQAEAMTFDALDFASHAPFIDSAERRSEGGLDGLVLCHGMMTPQADAEKNPDQARAMIDGNFTSAVSLLNLAAALFEPRRRGFICAISSVAGDRGRQSNYIYGAAKAGLTAALQGLRQRLAKSGVSVLTVKPGFVDTAMTFGMPGTFLVASPDSVARSICRAIDRRKNSIYVPWFWRYIMLIIRSIPEPIFKKLKL